MTVAAVLVWQAAATDGVAEPRRQTAPSIAGAWRVETAPHRLTACVVRGAATVTAGQGGGFDVRIQVKETCPQGDDTIADEQCRADVSDERVVVHCTLVRATTDTYIADGFQLVRRGDDMMVGRLVDAGIWNEPVTWRRAAPALVS